MDYDRTVYFVLMLLVENKGNNKITEHLSDPYSSQVHNIPGRIDITPPELTSVTSCHT